MDWQTVHLAPALLFPGRLAAIGWAAGFTCSVFELVLAIRSRLILGVTAVPLLLRTCMCWEGGKVPTADLRGPETIAASTQRHPSEVEAVVRGEH